MVIKSILYRYHLQETIRVNFPSFAADTNVFLTKEFYAAYDGISENGAKIKEWKGAPDTAYATMMKLMMISGEDHVRHLRSDARAR